MSAVENIRAKTEELRTRIQSRIAELRGGSTRSGLLSNFSNFSAPELMKGQLASEIRAKGILATARSRMEKIRGGAPSPAAQTRGEETITPPTSREEIYA